MSSPWWQQILRPDNLAELGPIVFLVVCVVTGGTIGIVKLVHRHRERMAMIEQGMNPDQPAPRGPTDGAE